MRKINTILITIVITIILLVVEIVLVRGATKYEPKVSIIYSSIKIPEGTIIEANMLEERSVSINAASRQSVNDANKIIGKRTKIEIEQGEMMLDGKLTDADEVNEIEVMDEDSRLFSIEFKPDQVNGWWIKEGQYVDIIFIPNEETNLKEESTTNKETITFEDVGYSGVLTYSEYKRINNVRVAALIDEKGNFIKNTGKEAVPRYISFELKKGLDAFFAYAKGNGRLEVSVIPYQNK